MRMVVIGLFFDCRGKIQRGLRTISLPHSIPRGGVLNNNAMRRYKNSAQYSDIDSQNSVYTSFNFILNIIISLVSVYIYY